ncbi:MAG: HigA family addiction module antidote protein [Thermoanaerobaculia bacterium]|jgi:addiction module HigA family antidote|nr:HigA family addiction module antidote protein [Thermoanaerobaculia bacterium]
MTNRLRIRKPTSPGEILREEFLVPLGLTQKALADHLGCDVKVVNRIVNGRCAVTAEMALKLGAAFRTSPDFWMNAQRAVDLYEAAGHVSNLPRPLLKAS